MKFIGQYIQSFIARFRSDVYLEGVSESAQDHVVGIDANGKLYKQDVATGDITGVSITTDSGGGVASANDTGGSADFSLLGGTGINITNSGTTITAVAVPAEIAKIHIQQTSFSRDIATTEFFIPFNSTAESTAITNVNVPMVMPVAGKLLKLHMRASQHHNTSSNTITFKLYDVDDGENWTTGASSVLGTKVIDGTARENIMVADFQDLTTSGASGTNAFSAGDSIGVTLQNSQDLATTNYLVTMVFELDFSSY